MVIEAKSLSLPDHTQLPESDGTFVKNFQEHPQSILLTDSILPRLKEIHPDGQYCIGQDCGIYWRLTDPPERGAEAPDWFYVPNVAPTLNGELRRSYVLWKELIAPLIVLEFVSGDGEEERDTTPYEGKFWIYENVIHATYYGIYEVKKASVEVYHLVGRRYEKMSPNSRGHYPIEPMGVELGIWQDNFITKEELPWLRWWDSLGNLLLTGNERAEAAELEAEAERQRAEAERQRAEAAQLEAEAERQRAEAERQRAKAAQLEAEAERQRAEAVELEAARLREQLRALGLDPDVIA
ncbi:Uma2 family endonuclease [Iningainema tapete]|uniref:Uma2 family endonuclease n=1 Tax=Iningainema tapete BLCC-T55 TaxID=2748662 RepID=A0A8J7BZ50_9CYAN|nr:Uma2 family endonuclease [Iningainema tapete]MBD2775158.1 Uma2 family endonuclease [Iningainema tapete BLCC-T55]